MLPRYFTPRSDPAPSRLRPALIASLLDAFSLYTSTAGGGGRTARDAAVVADRTGKLHLIDEDVPHGLPAALQSAFGHHEMAAGGLRQLDVAELWLFDLQMVEQPADIPGVNDPIWLYGRLYGPFPGSDPTWVDGQLTVTRADVLAGFVDEIQRPTRHPSGRCCHLVLPADTAESVAQGRGIVLAWPMLPVELAPPDPANEPLCTTILYDLLAATKLDLERAGIAHPLVKATLPVPSREDLVAELERTGWTVTGNTAIQRNKVTQSGIGSLLTAVLGAPDGMTRTLPPEAGLDAFVALATQALAGFPGWPDARHRALRARIRDRKPPTPVHHVMSPPDSPAAPHLPEPGLAPPAPRPKLPPKTADWMDDFVAEHQNPAHPTRVTRPAPKGASPKASPPKKPGWMDDFE